jgi:hypothetical protein
MFAGHQPRSALGCQVLLLQVAWGLFLSLLFRSFSFFSAFGFQVLGLPDVFRINRPDNWNAGLIRNG